MMYIKFHISKKKSKRHFEKILRFVEKITLLLSACWLDLDLNSSKAKENKKSVDQIDG